jgi:hypothetical protein
MQAPVLGQMPEARHPLNDSQRMMREKIKSLGRLLSISTFSVEFFNIFFINSVKKLYKINLNLIHFLSFPPW